MTDELNDVTHAIVAVFGGDNDLSHYVKANLSELDHGLKATKGCKFVAVTLSDFRRGGGRVSWHLPGRRAKEWKLGEINTGDVATVACFFALAMSRLPETCRLAIGFSSHGTGVFDERELIARSSKRKRRPMRTRTKSRHPRRPVSKKSKIELGAPRRRRRRRDVQESAVSPDAHTKKKGMGNDRRPGPSAEPLKKLVEAMLPSDGRMRAWSKRILGQAKKRFEAPRLLRLFGHDALTTREIAEALRLAFKWSGRKAPVDLLFFDSCYNGMIEVLYQCRRSARVIVASEDRESEELWDYSLWLRKMGSSVPQSPEAWGRQAVTAFEQASRGDPDPRTLAAVRTGHLAGIAGAFGTLVNALRDGGSEAFHEAKESREALRSFGDTSSSYDLRTFVSELKERATARAAHLEALGRPFQRLCGVRDACLAVERAFDDGEGAIVHSMQLGANPPPPPATGLAFWFPSTLEAFRRDAATYRRLGFERKTGWLKYLRDRKDCLPSGPC